MPPPLHLFDAVGIELEYMIVDADSLEVRPIADAVLQDESGTIVSEIEHGRINWSNELVSHVIELKTNGPAASVDGLAVEFQQHVTEVNHRLGPHSARLLPSAMHPWMDPHTQAVLWPHEYGAVYDAFNRIFDCRGHGWANLQSMHINLPFAGDDEFGRLHAAVRLLLPLLPALAASSPIVDGKLAGGMDARLEVYRSNSRRIPSVAGRVIPEQAFDQAAYNRLIFEPMFADIAPHDPDGVLQDEFLNARGAIARFSRGTIEIRLIDSQECPAADLAIAAATIAVLRLLVRQTWSDTAEQQAVEIDPLEQVLLSSIRDADRGVVHSPEVLQHFGVDEEALSLSELWNHVLSVALSRDMIAREHLASLEVLMDRGPLARRICQHLPETPTREDLHAVYSQLAECLATGTMFS
jgi:glutamate---cysteine ligase / carboxylate-amine ligase